MINYMQDNRYPSRRNIVYGGRGMVCTSQHLAAQAGLDILKAGGNAIDAAVATAACMTVVEPTSNGIGSDAFALVWTKGKLHGLNASGKAPMGLDADMIRGLGYSEMPSRGWIPVMVPGAPAAWVALNRRFGRLSLRELLQPAIRYAYEGYPVSAVVTQLWQQAFEEFSGSLGEPCFAPWFDTFAPEGRAPRAGEVWKSPGHGDALSDIAETEGESFYRGALARKMEEFARGTGGYLRASDLADYRCNWVEPICTAYRGYDVWEIPPNGDGIIALMALNILNGFSLGDRDDPVVVHRQIEALKLAFADGLRYVSDPSSMRVSVQDLLAPEYTARRRAEICDDAVLPHPGDPAGGGTIYLCTADQEGNMVSFIQSNYQGFGSGIVIPGTGISLQNRGVGFTLEPGHENCYAPGKKAFHTIIPAFLAKDGAPVGPFGVMGAYMQPQGHVQVVCNLLDFALDPQQALDAPRWQWVGGNQVQLEPGFSTGLVQELRRRGHEISFPQDSLTFGRGQMIFRTQDGVLVGATEPRADGAAAAW